MFQQIIMLKLSKNLNLPYFGRAGAQVCQCVCIRACVCYFVRVYVCVRVCMCVCLCGVYLFAYVCVCVHVCVRMYDTCVYRVHKPRVPLEIVSISGLHERWWTWTPYQFQVQLSATIGFNRPFNWARHSQSYLKTGKDATLCRVWPRNEMSQPFFYTRI